VYTPLAADPLRHPVMLFGSLEFAPVAPVEFCAPAVPIEPWFDVPIELFGEALLGEVPIVFWPDAAPVLLGDCVVVVLLAVPFGVCVVVVVVVLCDPVCEVPDDVAEEGLV
jgi:hypothetical protein